jgi:Phage regulatory protein Rha (Phage_pRha)
MAAGLGGISSYLSNSAGGFSAANSSQTAAATDWIRVAVVQISKKANPIADSRYVAAFFGKRHDNVLQAVSNMRCEEDFKRLNFQAFKSKDLTGNSTSHYLIRWAHQS